MQRPALAPLAALAALTACAMVPTRDDAAASLAAAESAFAAHSVREDMRAAFMAHFAPDGVFVRNGWVVARESLANRAAPPIILEWRPQYVEVAASGDMGLSTGPSRVTPRDKPGAAPSHGQFVSVWKRAPGEPWRVQVDLGIENEGPALWDQPLQARLSPAAPAGEGLAAAEASFATAARAGMRDAYRTHGASDLRLYRSGDPPRASRDAALASAWLARHARLGYVAEASETAASGDFGYVRGRVEEAGSDRTVGWFLRVWRREAAGWRIVMDVVNPVR